MPARNWKRQRKFLRFEYFRKKSFSGLSVHGTGSRFFHMVIAIVFCNFSKTEAMIKKIPGETWKPLMYPGWKQLRKKYALSSTGRVASYYENINSDGKLLSG